MEYSKDNNKIYIDNNHKLFVLSHPEHFKDVDYTKKLNEAIESSIFDYIDHPDKVYNPNNIINDKSDDNIFDLLKSFLK
jgi:hypothetical protein